MTHSRLVREGVQRKQFSLLFAVFLVINFLIAPTVGDAQESMAELVKRSDIIFTGMVTQIGTTSASEFGDIENVIELQITEILEKADRVILTVGDLITVKVNDLDEFQVDAVVTMYAQGWRLGDSIAVIEVGHTVSAPAPATGAGGPPETPEEKSDALAKIRSQQADESLRRRLETADQVVEGRVRTIAPMQLATSRGGSEFISEHDADWQEAVIEVTSTLKGDSTDEIIVRFPNSDDVAWFDKPKLSEGQEGVFVLTEDQVTGGGVALSRGGDVDAYTVLGANDVLLDDDYERVRMLLQKPSPQED